MRVGQITTWLSSRGGGIPAVVFPLATGLVRAGVEAPVFGLVEAGGAPLPHEPGFQVQTFRPLDGGLLGYAPGLKAHLLSQRLDLLHQHGLWQYPSIVGLRWRADTSLPYMVSPHGMLDPWALANSAWKKRLAGRLFQRRHLQGARCLHALNVAELAAIRGYGLQNPVAVVPNGVELPADHAPGPPGWATDLPPESKVLLFLGRIHPKKGLDGLLHAWRLSAPVGWHLVIAGWDQGGYEATLKRVALELGVAGTVTFAGPQFGEAKAASFHRADAFVLPSLSEGLPMAVLEAWSYRCPVLMTTACNLPEGFAAGAAMELPLEGGSMSRVFCEFMELSDTERRRMGLSGRRLVEERYSWRQVAQDMARVYEWAVGGGASPPVVDQ